MDLSPPISFETFRGVGTIFITQLEDLLSYGRTNVITSHFAEVAETFLRQADTFLDLTLNYPSTFCYEPPKIRMKDSANQIFEVNVRFSAKDEDCSIRPDKLNKIYLEE